MGPTNYFYDFVEPDWVDFQSNPSSIRHAVHVAVTSYHITTYFGAARGLAVAKICEQFQEKCQSFNVIQQIANTLKHSPRTQTRHDNPTVITEIVALTNTNHAPWDDGSMWDDGTGWEADYPRVSIKAEERYHDFEWNMRAYMQFLRKELF